MGVNATTEVREILASVRALRGEAVARERAFSQAIDALPVAWRRSAANLAHYLALRATDHAQLQGGLVRNGLSSLSRREAHVMPTLDAVERALAAMCGVAAEPAHASMTIDDGAQLLARQRDEGGERARVGHVHGLVEVLEAHPRAVARCGLTRGYGGAGGKARAASDLTPVSALARALARVCVAAAC